MPQILGWNQVAAPDANAAIAATQGAGQSFGRAADMLSEAAGRYNQTQSNIASNALLQKAQSYTNPDALNAALADGSLYQGFNPSNLNQEAITAVGNRSSTLINNAVNQEKLGQDTYLDQRTRATNALADAASSDLNRAYLASTSGKPTAQADANTILASSPAVLALRNQQLVDAQTSNLNNGQAATTQANSTSDRLDERMAEGEGLKLAGQVSTVGDVDNLLGGSTYANYSGHQKLLIRNAAINALNQNNPAAAAINGAAGGSMPGGGGGVADADDATLRGILGKTYGGGTLDDSIKTVGDYVNGGYKKVLAQKGSSAIGLYGINGGTFQEFGQKALGDNWQNADIRSYDTQDKVAHAIFDASKNDPGELTKRFASLGNLPGGLTAADVAKMPWEQARSFIGRGESSVDPTELVVQQAINDAGLNRQSQEANANTLAQAVTDTTKDSGKDIGSVADELATKFPGIDRGTRIKRLQSIIDAGNAPDAGGRTYNISPALAGRILLKNQKDEGLIGGALSGLSPFNDNLGSGVALNWDSAKKDVAALQNGHVQDVAATNARIEGNQYGVGVAKAQYQTALQGYSQALQDARTKKGYNTDLLQQRLDAVQKAAAAWKSAATSQSDHMPQQAFPSTASGQPADGNAKEQLFKGAQPPPPLKPIPVTQGNLAQSYLSGATL